MDTYWACYSPLAYLHQQPCEPTYEYFERYKYNLDEYPNHGFQFHELVKHFLDGMLPDERYILDDMAGRRIMECTPSEVWYLIEERAENTRPYTEYNPGLEQAYSELYRRMVELNKQMEEISEKLEKVAKDIRDLKSAPEPIHSSSDDEEMILPMIEQADEDTMDGELQVVPITSVEDVPTEEWTSLQCLDMSIEQNTVIACNPNITPISNLVLSSHVQNGAIQKALSNNQVWGSLEKVTMHIPMVRNPMRIQKSDQFLDGLCVNWKTRKKDMRGSLEKMDIHMVRARKQTPKLVKFLEGLHRTWKRRKKSKHIILDNEGSMFSVYMQKSRSTYGWKPGWNSWRSISHKVTRKVRRGVRKFDGVHPWAPNIY